MEILKVVWKQYSAVHRRNFSKLTISNSTWTSYLRVQAKLLLSVANWSNVSINGDMTIWQHTSTVCRVEKTSWRRQTHGTGISQRE